MFPASPPSFLATKNLTLGDLTCSEILSWLITLTLELCPPQVSRDCRGGVRLLTLNITARAAISNTDLPPPRISLNRHQPAGPVGMSLTLNFSPCICPWRLQSELRSPAICEKSHIQPKPLCLAAFMLPGSFKHCFLKSPSERPSFKTLLANLPDTSPKLPSASNAEGELCSNHLLSCAAASVLRVSSFSQLV